MFVGRQNELDAMNRRYEKGKFECIVIYGRRRVGKTFLINEFCKDKRTIFFSALNASPTENLEAFSKAIYACDHFADDTAPIYQSYDAAFSHITELSREKRLVLVIDEYPYLAKAEKSISSRLQHVIDHLWQNSSLYLILCGSSMSFMEYQVLGYESPLYGRRTAQFKIQSLTYREITAFYPHLSLFDQALLYGITGGIPHYVEKLEVEDDLDTALKENFFNPSGYLFEEPENLLKQELREPAVYNSVIAAIAGGYTRSNEISTKVGLESAVCSKYLRVLLELGIIKKETPVSEKIGKKTIYLIEDNLFRFWYRFVPANMSAIGNGRIDQIYDVAIKQHYSDYMGLVFEKICKEYLLKYADHLPIELSDIGQWWGSDSQTHTEIQIDIVGIPAEGNKYIIGSCKYRNEKIGIEELELLKKYASVFRKNADFYYYIFSKSGFQDSLRNAAETEKVTLVSMEDLFAQN